MQITIEPTDKLTTFQGAPVRVWTGVTDKGVRCTVFVRALAVAEGEDSTAFEEALTELPAPLDSVPLRMILP